MFKNTITTSLLFILAITFTACQNSPKTSKKSSLFTEYEKQKIINDTESKALAAALNNDTQGLKHYYIIEKHNINDTVLNVPILAHLLFPYNTKSLKYLLTLGANPTTALLYRLKDTNKWYTESYFLKKQHNNSRAHLLSQLNLYLQATSSKINFSKIHTRNYAIPLQEILNKYSKKTKTKTKTKKIPKQNPFAMQKNKIRKDLKNLNLTKDFTNYSEVYEIHSYLKRSLSNYNSFRCEYIIGAGNDNLVDSCENEVRLLASYTRSDLKKIQPILKSYDKEYLDFFGHKNKKAIEAVLKEYKTKNKVSWKTIKNDYSYLKHTSNKLEDKWGDAADNVTTARNKAFLSSQNETFNRSFANLGNKWEKEDKMYRKMHQDIQNSYLRLKKAKAKQQRVATTMKTSQAQKKYIPSNINPPKRQKDFFDEQRYPIPMYTKTDKGLKAYNYVETKIKNYAKEFCASKKRNSGGWLHATRCKVIKKAPVGTLKANTETCATAPNATFVCSPIKKRLPSHGVSR